MQWLLLLGVLPGILLAGCQDDAVPVGNPDFVIRDSFRLEGITRIETTFEFALPAGTHAIGTDLAGEAGPGFVMAVCGRADLPTDCHSQDNVHAQVWDHAGRPTTRWGIAPAATDGQVASIRVSCACNATFAFHVYFCMTETTDSSFC